MTALAGYWSLGSGEDPRANCERMLQAQRIYAPDPAALRSEGSIALGRRLFQTLAEDKHDHGPVIGAGGRWTLVADVRLDDREGLCSALGVDGPAASRLADSGLVMRAVERWGEEAIPRLIGDFAIALWDRDLERLHLARDFLGQRPLHFHAGPRFVAFATMPKGLLGLPEVPTGPNEQAVADFLALMPEARGASFFEGVERVQPGEVVTFTASKMSRARYWQYRPAPLRLKTAQDYAEAVREQMDRSVRSRLRGSGGRVAAHLSGGLDSSAVAATAARLLGAKGEVAAFTSAPRIGHETRVNKGRFADESAHAAAVAALYPNLRHLIVRSGHRSPVASLDRNFFLYDRPVLNLCNAVWLDAIADEAKRLGLGILLTGQMGNMSFSYSGAESLADLLGRGRLLNLAREMYLSHRQGTRLLSSASHALGPFLPTSMWETINRLAGRRLDISDYTLLRTDRAAALRARAAAAGLDFSYRPRRNHVAARLWRLGRVDAGNYQKGRLAGWGLDVRDPTADRRLIELCLSIPADQYLSHGQQRALARRAFADRLPEIVLQETRKGLQAADWHEGLSAGWKEAALEAERIAAVPAAEALLDTSRLDQLLQDRPDGRSWNSSANVAKYRLALLRGLSAGHFIRKALGAN